MEENTRAMRVCSSFGVKWEMTCSTSEAASTRRDIVV
jgi:hypothetical protein